MTHFIEEDDDASVAIGEPALSMDEVNDLKRLESLVETGITSAIDAGEAIYEIRTRRLFREHSSTWSEYIATRFTFKMSREHARRLEHFARISGRLDGKVPTERVARALRKAENPIEEVHRRAMEAVDGDVTRLGTKVIEAADREITRERELFAEDPKRDDLHEPDPPKLKTITHEQAILIGVKESRECYAEILRHYRACRDVIANRFWETLAGKQIDCQIVCDELKAAIKRIGDRMPHSFCPKCIEAPSEHCRVCGGSGVLWKDKYDIIRGEKPPLIPTEIP